MGLALRHCTVQARSPDRWLARGRDGWSVGRVTSLGRARVRARARARARANRHLYGITMYIMRNG